ncbi:MAG TPA: NAD(P)-dependent oxidoreductase, partial [Burkholderiales bacterium]|nr:NAD(P)-dependent oxidoreductase [Burkholderiales bacterium]
EAAKDCDFVMMCVGNDDDVRSVVYGENGALAGMKKGAILVDHTTASAILARELFEKAKEKGIGFVDAPVSGGQAGAENGQLGIMCGGEPATFEKAKPVIDVYAKMAALVGGPGAGQLTKMVNQICIAGLVQGLSEGLAFAKRAGLDIEKVISVISKGAAQSWQMENRWKQMNEVKFDGFGFAVDWMRKDLGICLEEAKKNGARLPVTALVDQYYAHIQARGGNRWDTSSLMHLLMKD